MKTNKGGKVLASGGFGCVFSPALKCKDAKTRAKGKISKLMTTRHAVEEYEEIISIENKLNSIKNYEDYFLLKDVVLCEPSQLTQTDLTAFDSKCSALTKKNLTSKNINEKLNDLMTLNMPNGGLPVDDYLNSLPVFETILKLHKQLVKTLKKGIVPMNEKYIYHCDLKDSNVLVQEDSSSLKTRLIDWGLSTEYKPFIGQAFPSTWRNRPLQFNVPFSVIIFSDFFIDRYTKYLSEGGWEDVEMLRPFVLEFVISWMKERGAGHYKFINEIMFTLNCHSFPNASKRELPKIIETQITMNYIVDYIVDVLVHFTRFRKDGKLDLREYLDKVFIKIVDIWGFISIYIPIVEILSNNYSTLTPAELQVFQYLQFIFAEYLYQPRHEPVDMHSLYSDLKTLEDTMNIVLFGRKQPSSSEEVTLVKEVINLASGVKTRKKRNKPRNSRRKTLTVVSREKRPKRFRRPFFLNVK